MRASTAMTSLSFPISGLMSMQTISGTSQTNSETRCRILVRASRFMGGMCVIPHADPRFTARYG